MLGQPARLGTPTRSSPAKRTGASRGVLGWFALLAVAAVVLLSVWRLRDGEQHDRRSLLSFGSEPQLGAAGSVDLSMKASQREFKLSRELNVTRVELLTKTQRVAELEAENSKVRRGMDDVLTELHKLFRNKTNGDTNALVEAEGLRGELITAHERADLAEQRTKLAAGLMAACEQRIQANGSIQTAFQALSEQLAGFKQTQAKQKEALAAGVNGTVHSAALNKAGGVAAAEVIQAASEAEQAAGDDSPQGGTAVMVQLKRDGLAREAEAAQKLVRDAEAAAATTARLEQEIADEQEAFAQGAAVQQAAAQQGAGQQGGAVQQAGGAHPQPAVDAQPQTGAAATLETGPGLEQAGP